MPADRPPMPTPRTADGVAKAERWSYSPMRIVDARWTPTVNMLVIACQCGSRFEHRADRWNARCPGCRRDANLGRLRTNYMLAGQRARLAAGG